MGKSTISTRNGIALNIRPNEIHQIPFKSQSEIQIVVGQAYLYRV
jgi:hypothetical protein